MAELMALEQCLEILLNSNSHNVIIEVDSELIIRAAKKICNGTSPNKVSKHWRFLQVFHRIHSHSQTLETISFVHVKRKANMLASCLANEGVTNMDSNSRYARDLLPPGIWSYGFTRRIKVVQEIDKRIGIPKLSGLFGIWPQSKVQYSIGCVAKGSTLEVPHVWLSIDQNFMW